MIKLIALHLCIKRKYTIISKTNLKIGTDLFAQSIHNVLYILYSPFHQKHEITRHVNTDGHIGFRFVVHFDNLKPRTRFIKFTSSQFKCHKSMNVKFISNNVDLMTHGRSQFLFFCASWHQPGLVIYLDYNL